MTIYDYTFADAVANANPPAGTSPEWYTANRGYTSRNTLGFPPPAGTTDGAAMEFRVQSGGQRKQYLRMTTPGTAVGDGEWLVRFQVEAALLSESGASQGIAILRAYGATNTENGYAVQLEAGQLRIGKFFAGTWTQLGSYAFAAPAGTWLGCRFKVTGTAPNIRLRARVWLATVAEPAAYQIDYTGDSSHASGSAGLYPGYTGLGGYWVDRAQLGTGTDAPAFLFPEAPSLRGVTPTERALLDAAQYNVHAAVEIQDADGVYRDYTSHGGADWLIEARIRAEIDAPMASAVVVLRREAVVAGVVKSLMPTILGSTINRNALGDYAPAIDANRGIRIKTATTAAGVAPIAGDWRYVIEGKVDTVDGKTASPILTVEMRDKGALLADTNIETVRTYGTGGVALETIIQAMLDDNLGAGVVTLYTPTPTGAVFNEFQQEQTTLFEAIRALALQVGHDVRYRYDATNQYRLTLYLPARGQTTEDWSFGPGNYFEVPEARISDADVRNAIRVWYTDGATHARLSVVATVPGSITKYGRRFMEIEEAASSNIDSAGEANAMATAAAQDLGSPYFEHAIESRYYWPLQLNDLSAFASNAVHYDATQKLAVIAYEHTLRRDSVRTLQRGRAAPLGAYRDWLFRGKVPAGPGGVSLGEPEALAANIFWRNDGTYFYSVYGDEDVASWKVVVRTDRPPTDAEVRAGATVNGRNISVDSTPTTYPEGTTIYIGAIPYQGAGATGLEATPAIQAAQARAVSSTAPQATIAMLSSTRTVENVRLSGVLGTNGVGPLTYRWRYEGSYGPGAWSNGGAFVAFPSGGGTYEDRGFSREETLSSRVVLEVKDAGGKTSPEASKTIASEMEAIDNATGRLLPTVPNSDGTYHAAADSARFVTLGVREQASIASVRALKVAGSPKGFQCASNPDFAESLSGVSLYNNVGDALPVLSRVLDADVPNSTGAYLSMAWPAGTTQYAPDRPGLGGFTLNLAYANYATAGRYRRGSDLIFHLKARIPIGYTVEYASNAIGTGASIQWMSPVIGTGGWFDYYVNVKVGFSGTFGATGYFWFYNGATPGTPFTIPGGGLTIDVALCECVDMSLPEILEPGYMMRDPLNSPTTVVLKRPDLVTSDTAAKLARPAGGQANAVDLYSRTQDDLDDVDDTASATKKVIAAAVDGSRRIDMGTSGVVGKHTTNLTRSSGDATPVDVIVGKIRNDGDLSSTMQQYDGVTARVIAKGHQAGTGRNGDAIVFAQAFQNVPMILLRGGIKYEPRVVQWVSAYASGSPQYEDLVALSPSASGFTLRARLRQKGALTARTADFPTNSVTSVGGDSGSATTANAPSSNDQYTVRFDVTVSTAEDPGIPVTAALTVALDTWDGSSWTERYTSTFTRSVTSPGSSTFGGTQVVNITIAGMGATSAFRVRAKAFSDSSSGGDSSFILHGRTAADSTRGVSYNTASDAYASATPDTDDVIYWEAIETA